jgi:hypothetical protein
LRRFGFFRVDGEGPGAVVLRGALLIPALEVRRDALEGKGSLVPVMLLRGAHGGGGREAGASRRGESVEELQADAGFRLDVRG